MNSCKAEADSPRQSNGNGTPKATSEKITGVSPRSGGKQGEDHDIIPSVKDRTSKNIFDLIPNRLEGHKKYVVQFQDKVKCTACNFIVSKDIDYILNHLTHKDHLQKSSMRPPRFDYLCEVCFAHVPNETQWLTHHGSTKHNDVVNNLGKLRQSLLQEYECLTCSLVIYGDTLSLFRHQNTFGFKADKKNSLSATLKKDVEDMFRNTKTTNELASRLLLACEESLKDDHSVKECLAGLEVAVRSEFPECKAHLFGSRISGLGSSKSDLDVFMDVGNMYEGIINQEHKKQQEILKKVKKILSEHEEEFCNIFPVATARTPIIRVVHTKTGIDCDLSFSHGLSVENSKYMRFCCDLQPTARTSLLVLKQWAAIHSLKDEISSYAFCMMFIFYLQINGYLLSVEQLRDLTKKDAPRINDWKVIEYNKSVDELKKHVQVYKGSVFDLVKGFFEMYKDFAFDQELICPLLGRTILTSKFENMGKSLPKEMSDYELRVQKDCDCEFITASSMCVQDPFDLGHNLTKKVPGGFRNKLVKLCTLSYNYMEKHSGSKK